MSVCFFVPADQAGTSGVAEEVESDIIEDNTQVEAPQQSLQQFWCKVTEDISKVNADDFKSQALPLARIKKIMKLDEEVKMISAEAPVLFAKAAEIFIHELTLRAWAHTEDNKRRTLQRNDIAMAISKCDQFDFLIDIVPRQEVKPNKPRYDHAPRSSHIDQVAHHQAALQNAAQPQIVLQACGQVSQTSTATPSTSSSNVAVSQQPVTLVQQVLTPSGELQQLPIQLTQAQLNMIRLQVQNNPNQPIIIQAQSQQSPQIIQVSSQGQHQPQQQVFLAQVATSQDDS
ncbi:nuclear transcription factor Y subunit gamma [Spodoptera frugiperda]|uniref:Nuclear transcription factor Y subunit gamma n=1 Tax=Spodoptera frugiperda TaxID=7108 RepID=A0A2H1WRV3_SPOFR|nr:nuclear transcription factor Y subunit gamma [Spodoptera frugiperda]